MIVLISGRSGSGKTTAVKSLIKLLGKNNVSYLHQDSYYKDQSHIPYEERELINYDNPKTIELELFFEHLKLLAKNKIIQKPIYDFVTHTRKKDFKAVTPKPIIIGDGIYAYYGKELRSLADLKVFVDAPMDICFIRRLLRDTKERDRSIESVINQYISTVKPMQDKYVAPMKLYADFIIKDGGFNIKSISELSEIIKNKL